MNHSKLESTQLTRFGELFADRGKVFNRKTDPGIAIKSDTGTRLSKAREKLKLSQTDIADQLRLSTTIIDAIEARQYDKLFGKAYATGYVRAYASAVGLNADEIIANDPDLGVVAISEPNTENFAHRLQNKTANRYNLTWSTIVFRMGMALALVGLTATAWNYHDELLVWWNNSQEESILEVTEPPTNQQRRNSPLDVDESNSQRIPS